jgi:hypothetical protein
MEPPHAAANAKAGTFAHRSQFVAPYVRIRARRVQRATDQGLSSRVWTPS